MVSPLLASKARGWVQIHYRRSRYLQHSSQTDYASYRMFRRLEPYLSLSCRLDLAANANSDSQGLTFPVVVRIDQSTCRCISAT
jgi:hypothetical protein